MHTDKLLLIEDESTRTFCCDLQSSYLDQIAKLKDVKSGKRERTGGVIAIGSAGKTSIQDQPILCLADMICLLMADRPSTRRHDTVRGKKRLRQAWSFLATASPQWQGGGIQIGEEGLSYVCNFFNMPRRRTQVKRGSASHAGLVRAPRPGQVVIYRVGRYLDLCIGSWHHGTPAICFRFFADDFLSVGKREPIARIIGGKPEVRPEMIEALEPGELYACGQVRAGKEVVKAEKPINYVTADVDMHQVNWRHVTYTLDADERRTFRAALKMSDLLSEGNNLAPRLQEARTLVEFPAKAMGSFVVGQFTVTPAMSRDLLAALGPDGLQRGEQTTMLKATAATTSRIKAIGKGPSATTIVYENGREQILPPTVQLTKLTDDSLVELTAGMSVKVSEQIGDYIDRFEAKQMDFPELSARLGTSLVEVLEALIIKTSVLDARITPGMLIDYQYAEPRIEKTVNKSVRQKTYLDFSTLVDLYDPESGFIMIPVGSPSYPLYELNTSSMQILFKRQQQPQIHTSKVDSTTGEVTEEAEEILGEEEANLTE